MGFFKEIITPNQKKNPPGRKKWIAAFWILIAFSFWQFAPLDFLPRPLEVANAFVDMWMNDGLGQQLITSYTVQLEAIGIAVGISLLLSYASLIQLFRPVVVFISTLRFISLAPLVLYFTLLVSAEARTLKVSLLVFSIAVFYIPSMLTVIMDIPSEELDHARTLRMSDWQTTIEVDVIGKLDAALEQLRQNAAMGWMMLTMVEGLVRGEGGIGTLLLNETKHFHLPEIAAIIVVLFLVGFGQDQVFKRVHKFFFSFALINKEGR